MIRIYHGKMNIWQSRDNWQKFFTITAVLVLIVNSVICFYISEDKWIFVILNLYVISVIIHNELNNRQVVEWK